MLLSCWRRWDRVVASFVQAGRVDKRAKKEKTVKGKNKHNKRTVASVDVLM